MPPDSIADAIVELVPLGAKNDHALELFGTYRSWAKRRGYSVDMVCEPLTAAEPIVAAIGGHYAFGYLRLEAGHHRFRDERSTSVVRVAVLPWLDRAEDITPLAPRALKKTGLLGGRVRSRMQIAGTDLVIQNERTLAENGSFATSVAASYRQSAQRIGVEVRRYDRAPFMLKDSLVGTIGRADTLSPDRFHDLLSERVDETHSLGTQPG